jgi:alpha-beta hydrolase superfamily lysophospholipase
MSRGIRKLLIAVASVPVLIAAAVAALVAVPPGRAPAPMESIRAPFVALDYSDLPPTQTVPARDGLPLAYRYYPAAAPKVAVLVHGSSSNGKSMHALARGLAQQGVASVYALDIRGHGESGPHGDIAYVGQLEDDLADFAAWLRTRHAGAPLVLVGFSSGGGFVSRVAGGSSGSLFEGYLLVSPYLGYNAPTSRPYSEAPWAKADVPRIIGLGILSGIGIRAGQGLTVLQFAVAEGSRAQLTPEYSYRLMTNFASHPDYRDDFKRATKPMAVLVGSEDEVLYPERFPRAIADAAAAVPVRVVSGVGHTGMIADPRALAAVEAALRLLPTPDSSK